MHGFYTASYNKPVKGQTIFPRVNFDNECSRRGGAIFGFIGSHLEFGGHFGFQNVINRFHTLGNLLIEPKVYKIGQTRDIIPMLALFSFTVGVAFGNLKGGGAPPWGIFGLFNTLEYTEYTLLHITIQ